MDVAVKVNEDEKLAELIAVHLADNLKPVVQTMVNKAVEDALPGHGMNKGELSAKLKLSLGTDAFERIAYQSGMPRYESGNDGRKKSDKSRDRWYSKAVDKFMETYTED